MTDAHLLTKDDTLEMMVVTRINREFMKHMHRKHNNLTREQVGKTVVELADTDQEKEGIGLV